MIPAVPGRLLAQIAADQYRTRQAKAQTVVRNGGMTRTEAERHLRPWLAIACMAGASTPEINALMADLHELNDASVCKMSAGALRWVAAEEICPREIWAPVLQRARDAAFDRFAKLGDDPTALAAAELQKVALALQYDINGHPIPPYRAPDLAPQQVAA